MTHGPQAGILNRPQEHELVVAYELLGTRDRATTVDTLEQLRALIARELRSDIDEIRDDTDKSQPFTETGELGYTDNFNRSFLTITVGYGPAAFDALEVPAALRPADLIAAPFDQIGMPASTPGAGDIVVQINTDSAFVAEHVQRRIEFSLAGRLQTVWAVRGDQRFTSRAGRASSGEARALIGFHDGTSNLDPVHVSDDRELVFVDPANMADYPANPPGGPQPAPQPGQPGYGNAVVGPVFPNDLQPVPTVEPSWTKDGSYLFVQAIEFGMSEWDHSPLGTQETIVGRYKRSGASLDVDDLDTNREMPPAFATNPADVRVDPTSHIRKSNPRSSPDDLKRRVFRRGYPLIIADGTGTTRRGLIFQSFSRSISTQIGFILRAWMFNPDFPTPQVGPDRLNHFMHTICGGYYFVPPLLKAHRPTSWAIPPNTEPEAPQ